MQSWTVEKLAQENGARVKRATLSADDLRAAHPPSHDPRSNSSSGTGVGGASGAIGGSSSHSGVVQGAVATATPTATTATPTDQLTAEDWMGWSKVEELLRIRDLNSDPDSNSNGGRGVEVEREVLEVTEGDVDRWSKVVGWVE